MLFTNILYNFSQKKSIMWDKLISYNPYLFLYQFCILYIKSDMENVYRLFMFNEHILVEIKSII